MGLLVLLIFLIPIAYADIDKFEFLNLSQHNEIQFIDSQNNVISVSHHIFETGKSVKMQNNIHNNLDSNLKGVWKVLIQDPRSGKTVETVKVVDIELLYENSKLFEWEQIFIKKGMFSFISIISYPDHQAIEAFDSDIVVVDKLSKAYSKNNGCPEELEVIIKPDFSTVVCVTDNTLDDLTDRGWHKARGF